MFYAYFTINNKWVLRIVKITSVDIESNKSNPTARSLTPYQLNNNGVLELEYDQRGFTKAELDRIAPNNPVVIQAIYLRKQVPTQ